MFLYQLRDMQLAALAPWHFMALAVEKILNHPLCPLANTALGQTIAERFAALEQTTRLWTKVPFHLNHTKVKGKTVTVREETLERTPFCELIHFKRVSADPTLMAQIEIEPHVLIVMPYSGHCAAVMRDTVRAMLPTHDVIVTEWADAKFVPSAMGPFDLDDQIAYLIRTIRKLGSDLHLIAISQASLPALCAIALLAEAENPCEPRSLTLIGGPIDATRATSPIAQVALTHPLAWFKDTQIQFVPPYYPGAFRCVYPGFMRLLNRMSMISNIQLTEQKKYFAHLIRGCEESPQALGELYQTFLAVTDVPAELYLQFVERAYQQAALATGAFIWRGKRVNPAAIRNTALLTIEAELDDFSPPGQTSAALDLCTGLRPGQKQAHLEIEAGHYSVFTGRKWRNTLQPMIQAFIRKHHLSLLG